MPARSPQPLRGGKRAALAVWACLLVALCVAPLSASSASSVFVSSSGVQIAAPLRVQSEDVGAALRDLRALAVALRADVDALQQMNARLQANLTATNELVAAQQEELAAQQILLSEAHATILAQQQQIVVLQSYDAANSLRVDDLVSASAAANATLTAHAGRLLDLGAQDALHSAAIAAGEAVDRAQNDAIGGLSALTANHSATLVEIEAAAVTLSGRVDDAEAAAVLLGGRVGDVEAAAVSLTARVAEAEEALTAVNATVQGHSAKLTTHAGQIGALQLADVDLTAAAAELTTRVTAAEDLTADKPLVVLLKAVDTRTASHSSQISALQSMDTTIVANATALKIRVAEAEAAAAALAATVDEHTTQIVDLQSADESIIDAAAALAGRVTAAEELTGPKLLVTTVKGHTADITALQSANVTITNAATALTTRVSKAETLVVDSSPLVTAVLALQAADTAISTRIGKAENSTTALAIVVSNFQSPVMYRFTFNSSQSWTVPAGVRSAFVTMAGGGGSGWGWRISNALATGNSGGFVMNQPIALVGGETLQITVGEGGIAFAPIGNFTNGVFSAPVGDNGLAGYPGNHSSIVSTSRGELLRCDGGSGASPGGIDAYDGGLVAGNLPGATVGSGNPPLLAPVRPAAGTYRDPTGPGACGPDKFGLGTRGSSTWTVSSGYTNGGLTPLGAGSGGGVGRSGCYVTPSTIGACVSPGPGVKGVVHIDVMY